MASFNAALAIGDWYILMACTSGTISACFVIAGMWPF
jgi:hypothetical protein